jgi:8-oxo-dGTP diphosphatase
MPKISKMAEAVVFDYGKDGPLFLLLQRLSGTWQFIMGKIEADETPEEAIRREIKEETDVSDFKIIKKLSGESLFSRKGTIMKVTSFLVHVSKENRIDLDKQKEKEHSEYTWATYDKARSLLKYDNQKEILEKARNALTSI